MSNAFHALAALVCFIIAALAAAGAILVNPWQWVVAALFLALSIYQIIQYNENTRNQ
jgi:hypothetical protein